MKNEENMNTLHGNAGAANVPDDMLERISGGMLNPDTEENRRRWLGLLGEIRYQLNSIGRETPADDVELHESIAKAMEAAYDCENAVIYGGNLFGEGAKLYSRLFPFRDDRRIARKRDYLYELMR